MNSRESDKPRFESLELPETGEDVKAVLDGKRDRLLEELPLRNERVRNYGRKWVLWAGVLLMAAFAGFLYPAWDEMGRGSWREEETFLLLSMLLLFLSALSCLVMWRFPAIARVIIGSAIPALGGGIMVGLSAYALSTFSFWGPGPSDSELFTGVVLGLISGFAAMIVGYPIAAFLFHGAYAASAARIMFPTNRFASGLGRLSGIIGGLILLLIYGGLVVSFVEELLRRGLRSDHLIGLVLMHFPLFLFAGVVTTIFNGRVGEPEKIIRSARRATYFFLAFALFSLMWSVFSFVYENLDNTYVFRRGEFDPYVFGEEGLTFAFMALMAVNASTLFTYFFVYRRKRLAAHGWVGLGMVWGLATTVSLYLMWLLWMLPMLFIRHTETYGSYGYGGVSLNATRILSFNSFYEDGLIFPLVTFLVAGTLILMYTSSSLATVMMAHREWRKSVREEVRRLEIELEDDEEVKESISRSPGY